MMLIECIKFSPDKIRRGAKKPLYTEYRLDFYPDGEKINFAKFPKNSILTCKGEMLSEKLVRKMFSSKAMVDIDFDDIDKYRDLIDPTRLILSMHLDDFCEDRIVKFCESPQQAKIYKLIVEAKSFMEILSVSFILDSYPKRKFIYNVKGKWALFQRALFNTFGSEGVYTGLEEEIYDGQPLSADIALIVSQLISPDTHVIPIVGDHRINTSGSIKIGNPKLYESGLKTVYLPIPAADLEEFFETVMFLRLIYSIGGFAITSPFKSQMNEFFGCGLGAINTLQIVDGKHDRNHYNEYLDAYIYAGNTDIIALKWCLSRMAIRKYDSILIYGSGACAEAFICELKRLGYSDISLTARNEIRSDELRAKYDIKAPLAPEYQLLINASPLGQSESDDLTVLPIFRSLINLPLPQPLVRLENYAIAQNIPMISSTKFWEVQFLEQVLIFEYPESQSLDTNE